jgi:glycosyltransferase involved in cell wall biosynthesis
MTPLNILFLTAHLPVPGLHGGGVRMYHNLKILAGKHRVTLLSFIEDERERERLPFITDLGVTARTILRHPSRPRHLLQAAPPEHDEYASEEMRVLVRQFLESGSMDVVQAEYLQMGQHVPACPGTLKILTEHEVQFASLGAKLHNQRGHGSGWKRYYDWMVQFNYEVRMCRRFNRIVCMTDEDRAMLERFVPSEKLRTIPIGVDCDFFSPSMPAESGFATPRLLFVGNYRHPPNQEAVYYFVAQILPLIHREFPDVELEVVGANIHLLDGGRIPAHQKVRMTGYVEDLRCAYREACIFVAPILSGNGMRVKVLEAGAMGMAVVASPLAIQGFPIGAGECFRVADSPQLFANDVLSLLRMPGLRRQLGVHFRELVERHFDWKVIGRQFLQLVEG